jgi:hypothetical protein
VWEGSLPGFPEAQTRIEAAAFKGRPVSFGISGPWISSTQMESRQSLSAQIGALAAPLVLFSATVGGIFFARRNIRLGRGDRRNANRLALFVLGFFIFMWALAWPWFSYGSLLIFPYGAILIWIIYIAVEPFVRRRWPQVLISWTRFMSGELRDPLVARDIFIGCTFGVLGGCLAIFGSLLPLRFLAGHDVPNMLTAIGTFLGPRYIVIYWLARALFALLICLATLCVLVVLRVLLRNQKAAIVVCIVLIAADFGPSLGYEAGLIYGIAWFFVLMRVGFAAAVFAHFTLYLINTMPMTLDTSAWYSGDGYLALTIFGAIVLYAFRASLGGQSLFGRASLED